MGPSKNFNALKISSHTLFYILILFKSYKAPFSKGNGGGDIKNLVMGMGGAKRRKGGGTGSGDSVKNDLVLNNLLSQIVSHVTRPHHLNMYMYVCSNLKLPPGTRRLRFHLSVLGMPVRWACLPRPEGWPRPPSNVWRCL